MDLELIGFLKDGKYRLSILKEIYISPKLPSEIAKKFEVNRSSISRILRDLKKRNLVSIHSTSSRTKLYAITNLGREAIAGLNDK